jgi:hypothetical protein
MGLEDDREVRTAVIHRARQTGRLGSAVGVAVARASVDHTDGLVDIGERAGALAGERGSTMVGDRGRLVRSRRSGHVRFGVLIRLKLGDGGGEVARGCWCVFERHEGVCVRQRGR